MQSLRATGKKKSKNDCVQFAFWFDINKELNRLSVSRSLRELYAGHVFLKIFNDFMIRQKSYMRVTAV